MHKNAVKPYISRLLMLYKLLKQFQDNSGAIFRMPVLFSLKVIRQFKHYIMSNTSSENTQLELDIVCNKMFDKDKAKRYDGDKPISHERRVDFMPKVIPYLDADERKDERLALRLTKAELTAVEEAAARCGVPVAKFARQALAAYVEATKDVEPPKKRRGRQPGSKNKS